MSTALEPHENIEPLEKSKHQQLRLSKLQTFNFTKTISSVPISFSEMQPASQFYPIILPADGNPTPMALLSLKEGTNRYVDEQGRWKVPYIPLCIRLYPFVLAKVENKEDQYALCLDRNAEHFAAGQGEPLFTADGEPNEFVQGVFNTLKLYQQELALTKAMFTALAEKELIAKDYLDKLQRTMAEYDNFRKRTTKEKAQMYENGAKEVVEKFLPIIDNFERALGSVSNEENGSAFVQGIEMIYKLLF